MNTLIHLVRKDFAFAKPWLIGTCAILVLIAVLPAIPVADLAEPLFILNLFGPLLLIFAATLRIMRTDSWMGSAGFLDTRPLTGRFLMIARLVSIFGFVLVPAVIASLLGVIAMRVDPSPADYGLLVMEISLDYGLAISVALLVGAFTRSIGLATILTFTLGALLLWLGVTIHGRPGSFRFLAEGLHLKASQWLVTEVLVLISAILITLFWMTWRQPARTWVVAALALGLTVSAGSIWKVNFVRYFACMQVPATNRARLVWLSEPRISGSSQNNVSFTSIERPARVSGLTDGWVGYPLGFHAKANFRDGAVILSEETNSRTYGDFTVPLLPSLGGNLPDDHRSRSWNHEFSTWFVCETSRIHDQPDHHASVSGEATVELYQPLVLANLPPTAGASAAHGRFRYRIESIESFEGNITVRLKVRGVPLASRGDFERSHDNIEIILIDPASGEHTVPGGSGGSSRGGGGLLDMTRDLRIEDWSESKNVGTAEEFLNTARLYVIGRNYGGTITLPYEIPEMSMETIR